jgi:hypothetical protein
LLCCVGSGLCDGLITPIGESHRERVFVCDIETSVMRRPRSDDDDDASADFHATTNI